MFENNRFVEIFMEAQKKKFDKLKSPYVDP